MKKLLLVLVFLLVFFLIFCPQVFSCYKFLSPESNAVLENLKEKFREKEIVLEKEEGIVWIVVLSPNDEVLINQLQEEIEGQMYTITEITVINSKGESRIVWGFAAKEYPYNIPRLCFPLD